MFILVDKANEETVSVMLSTSVPDGDCIETPMSVSSVNIQVCNFLSTWALSLMVTLRICPSILVICLVV